MAAARPLDELAHELGRLRWLQLQLFEVLGRWATAPADDRGEPLAAEVRGFGEWSNRLAWHAELVAGRIPDLPGLGVANCTTPDEAATTTLAEAIDVPAAQRAEVLQQRLLPALAERVHRIRLHTDPQVDGPTGRLVDLLAHDLMPRNGHGPSTGDR